MSNANQPLLLLCTDFSDASFRAFEPSVDLARRLGAKVVLTHIVHDMVLGSYAPFAPPEAAPDLAELVEMARGRLQTVRQRLPADLPVETDVLTGESVADAISRYAEERKVSFIALSTHGRTGLARLVMGSVTEAVLRRASVPVVVFPVRGWLDSGATPARAADGKA